MDFPAAAAGAEASACCVSARANIRPAPSGSFRKAASNRSPSFISISCEILMLPSGLGSPVLSEARRTGE